MIVLDLPAPPSVNRTRKVHWRGYKKLEAWRKHADGELMARRWRCPPRPLCSFAVHVTVADDDGCDIDNLKAIADYLKAKRVIIDDGRRYMRDFRVTVSNDIRSGEIRVTVTPIKVAG